MTKRNAAIFDRTKERREAFDGILKSAGWDCKPMAQVYEKSTKALVEPDGNRLIMLHLRGPDDNKDSCGNGRSWEFLTSKLATMPNAKKTCLIAYTGGGVADCPEPVEFAHYRNEEGWPWVYFNGVNAPQDINLGEFVEAWGKAPDGEPPLQLLFSSNPRIDALKLLILGFQAAHGCGAGNANTNLGGNRIGASPTEVRGWTESLDWWLPVLGNDPSAQNVQKLIESLCDSYSMVVVGLAEFYRLKLENSNIEFPEKLRNALCDVPLGSKGAT